MNSIIPKSEETGTKVVIMRNKNNQINPLNQVNLWTPLRKAHLVPAHPSHLPHPIQLFQKKYHRQNFGLRAHSANSTPQVSMMK